LRVIVDTSVWVDYLRGRSAKVRKALDALLDEDRVGLAIPVRIELLGGCSRRDASRLRRLLDAIPTYHPGRATWTTIESWVLSSAAAGQRFGFGDLLIGAIASENGLSVWSRDEDFERMAELKLIETYRS
jgi:predicted nucleic acid-binding protein